MKDFVISMPLGNPMIDDDQTEFVVARLPEVSIDGGKTWIDFNVTPIDKSKFEGVKIIGREGDLLIEVLPEWIEYYIITQNENGQARP